MPWFLLSQELWEWSFVVFMALAVYLGAYWHGFHDGKKSAMRTFALLLTLLLTGAAGARPPQCTLTAKPPQATIVAVTAVDPFHQVNASTPTTTCDCAKTGKCTCPPGECDCPDCPRLHWKRVSPTLLQLRKGKNVLGSWNEATSIFTNTYGVQYEWDGKHDGDVSALTSSPATVQPVFQPQFFAPPPPMFAGGGFARGGGGC